MDKEAALALIEELKTLDVWNYECTFKAAARAINRLNPWSTMPRIDVFDRQCRLSWGDPDETYIELYWYNTDQLRLTTANLDEDYSVERLQVGMFIPDWLIELIDRYFGSVGDNTTSPYIEGDYEDIGE